MTLKRCQSHARTVDCYHQEGTRFVLGSCHASESPRTRKKGPAWPPCEVLWARVERVCLGPGQPSGLRPASPHIPTLGHRVQDTAPRPRPARPRVLRMEEQTEGEGDGPQRLPGRHCCPEWRQEKEQSLRDPCRLMFHGDRSCLEMNVSATRKSPFSPGKKKRKEKREGGRKKGREGRRKEGEGGREEGGKETLGGP